MKDEKLLPTAREMVPGLVDILRERGSEVSVRDLESAVAKVMGLSDFQLSLPHDKSRNEFQYRLAWARTYAKKMGLITTTSRKGYWVIADSEKATK